MEQSPGTRRLRPPMIVVHVVAVALAFVNLAIWYVWRPADDDLTSATLAGLSALKLLMILAILWQLRELHVLIGRRAVSPKRAMAGWTVGMVGALAILMPLRESIAPAFETATTHLVRPSEEIGYGYPFLDTVSEEQLRHRRFVVQWRRGEILAIEALLVAVVAITHVVVARKYGSIAGLSSLLLAGMFSLAAFWVFGRVFGLVMITYDTFYLGALTGPLAFDFVMPRVLYPTTPLAAPFYLALSLSSWTIAAGRIRPVSKPTARDDAPGIVQPTA